MRIVETKVYDSNTGELLSERTNYGNVNGDGWLIVYRKAFAFLATHCDSAVTFKVFCLLCSRIETYDSSGVVCSRRWLMEKLNVSRKSVYSALEWLKKTGLIVETVNDGCSEFLVNPEFVTIGKNRSARALRFKELTNDDYVRRMCKIYGFPYPLPDGFDLPKEIAAADNDSLQVVSAGDTDLIRIE